MPVAKGKTKKGKKEDFGINIEEMAEAGLHLGHRTSKVFPKMKLYIYGVRSSIHIIDLEKTAQKFKEALEFIQKLASENKTLLLVGTKVQINNLVKGFAEKHNLPYVTERWLGGTFTNFGSIKKRVDYLKDLEEKKEKGELEKYTKKERIKMDREIKKLETKIGGIKSLGGLPDAIFVFNMRKDDLAIKEARKKGIKVIAIADTNVDPTPADYLIPANDDAFSSVKYILEKVEKAIEKGKENQELRAKGQELKDGK